MSRKKVLVVTGTRAEFGLLLPVIREIQKSKKLTLRLLATGMHTLTSYGHTIDDIYQNRIPVNATVPVQDSDSMLAGLSKEITGIERYCSRERPDIILVLGDRDEAFAAAIVGGHLGIAVAHIHGGDTLGYLVDEAIRHSISKFAHVHFPVTRQSAKRLESLGEEKSRIHLSGSPAFDAVSEAKLPSRGHLAAKLHLDPRKDWITVVQHPTPLDPTPLDEQIRRTLLALKHVDAEKVIIYPNSDTGSKIFITHIESVRKTKGVAIVQSLPRTEYLGLLKASSAIVGNSSSGLLESGFFHLPAINIGGRQTGRECGANVLHVPYDSKKIAAAITRALSPVFQMRAKRARNPYGSRGASARIVRVLEKLKINPQLFHKKMPL